MGFLSEQYKNRIRKLAGLVTEVVHDFSAEERENAFIGSDKRVKYDKDLMVKAIREGWEVGILFYSRNDKYQMRTYKSRIICPVALGLSKKGNPVLRALHRVGQSEGAGIKQRQAGQKNWRSTEVKDEWRLFKISNISRMWLTGRFFQIGDLRDSRNGAGYSTGKDKGMNQVEIQFNSAQAKKFQDDYNKDKKEPVPTTIVQPKGKVATEPKQGAGQLKSEPPTVTEPSKSNGPQINAGSAPKVQQK